MGASECGASVLGIFCAHSFFSDRVCSRNSLTDIQKSKNPRPKSNEPPATAVSYILDAGCGRGSPTNNEAISCGELWDFSVLSRFDRKSVVYLLHWPVFWGICRGSECSDDGALPMGPAPDLFLLFSAVRGCRSCVEFSFYHESACDCRLPSNPSSYTRRTSFDAG